MVSLQGSDPSLDLQHAVSPDGPYLAQKMVVNPASLLGALASNPQFGEFYSLVCVANLGPLLNDTSKVFLGARTGLTLFVPLDLGLDFTNLSSYSARKIVLYHMLGATVQFRALQHATRFLEPKTDSDSVQRQKILAQGRNDGSVVLNKDSVIISPDITASNGVIHVISSPLNANNVPLT